MIFDSRHETKIPLNTDPSKNGVVTNEETAIKIAEVIWLSIYGDQIYKQKPFKAISHDSVWVVDGTVHEQYGGAPHIVIRKKDGKIMDVTHYL